MLQSFLSRTALISGFVSLAVLTVACEQNQQTTAPVGSKSSLSTGSLAAIKPSSQVKPASKPLKPAPTQLSAFEMALSKAAGAKSSSKSANTADDWNLVINQFQEAIAFMKKVRRDSPNFPFAQRKIKEYNRQIALARQKARPRNWISSITEPKTVVIEVPKAQTTVTVPPHPVIKAQKPSLLKPTSPALAIAPYHNEVFIAPIKRRIGKTPIIEVTFNGTQRFEMIVDTGASGTVITQKTAAALGVVPVGKTRANTASAKAVEFAIGYLDSMEAGGMMINKVPVAIAGTELDTGLLGHDFFGNHDVTIKRHVVEFRPQINEVNSVGIEPNPPAFSRGYRFVKFP
ncbi:TIGR02281 family clan AA aspartic protease [Anabaena sp. UHCC 0204]|uniref:retropepsin-like aspartic protease family protein n=1 Tax=Anabaena sp. UHCC 0204 TaxID=2590009 RepID=UPI001446F7DE|nr:retropepsin-like aspartic protease [Anabaena sp. UHCC 0204]